MTRDMTLDSIHAAFASNINQGRRSCCGFLAKGCTEVRAWASTQLCTLQRRLESVAWHGDDRRRRRVNSSDRRLDLGEVKHGPAGKKKATPPICPTVLSKGVWAGGCVEKQGYIH